MQCETEKKHAILRVVEAELYQNSHTRTHKYNEYIGCSAFRLARIGCCSLNRYFQHLYVNLYKNMCILATIRCISLFLSRLRRSKHTNLSALDPTQSNCSRCKANGTHLLGQNCIALTYNCWSCHPYFNYKRKIIFRFWNQLVHSFNGLVFFCLEWCILRQVKASFH